mgnify:CR=1 FL=1
MGIRSEYFAYCDRFISQISKILAFTCESELKAACKCTGFIHCTSSQHEHPVERCWVLLSQIWNWSNFRSRRLNISVVVWLYKVECICKATLNEHVEPTQAQCPAYPSNILQDGVATVRSFQESSKDKNSTFSTSFFFVAFLCSSMSSLTRSAAKHFRVLRRWIYLRFSAIIQHEPLWNLRNAQFQHVESLLRSFERPAEQHRNKHLTCWELV